MKVGASIVSCRRGGNSATFETLNQFYGISGMPTVPSTYWNDVHGYKGEDVLADPEAVETVRNMATNIAFMIKSIQAGKDQYGKPDVKHKQFVNFIR
jgi:multimeric flavodoxin WrbA